MQLARCRTVDPGFRRGCGLLLSDIAGDTMFNAALRQLGRSIAGSGLYHFVPLCH
jgi:hypothetical protein